MLTRRPLQSVCLSCRLRLLAARGYESRNPVLRVATNGAHARSFHLQSRYPPRRQFSYTTAVRDGTLPGENSEPKIEHEVPPPARTSGEIEEIVRMARQKFGDTLPEDYLSGEEYTVYERLYGRPVFTTTPPVEEGEAEEDALTEEEKPGTYMLLRKGKNGEMEEVEFFHEEEGEPEELHEDAEEEETDFVMGKDREPKRRAREVEQDSEDQITDDIYEFEEEEWSEDGEDFMRTHPLTVAGRFATFPSTIQLPKDTLVDPVKELLSGLPNRHISDAAHRLFGGVGLPYSSATPRIGTKLQQKPIALDPAQGQMAPIDADAYVAAVMPAVYASVKSILVEIRKRLGSGWIERLLEKEGGPLVLDAGSGGVGVLAWREIVKAEWERLQEESGDADKTAPAPTGKATVLTGSDTLRHRASRLLEKTTFLPRLPDTVVPDERPNAAPRKVYDLIIAPHTLWGLKDEYRRKMRVNQYWSLLNPDGGVLVILEKGVPRGFEVVAAARELLLHKHIASPGATHLETRIDDTTTTERFREKEKGMIIAPCTNHTGCPMYERPGITKGRKDFCYFSQRFIRPTYLQNIYGAKGRNHEDVQFSYLAVQRGRDQRREDEVPVEFGTAQQGDEGTNSAFEGYEDSGAKVNGLSLPRNVLPPLKRRGHVVLDLCTPAGKLERWTVPRSFSKQAYKDARHAQWGDLWALGAKTRVPRTVRLGKHGKDEEGKKKRKGKNVIEVGVDSQGFVDENDMRLRNNGRNFKPRKTKDGRKGRREKPVRLEEE